MRDAGERGRGAAGGRIRRWAVRLACAALWLALWQLAAWAVDLDIVLVGPLEVLARLAELAATAEFWASLAVSLGRVLAGLLAAVLAGTALAAAASRSRAVRALLAPLMGAAKAVPVASFVILVLLWVSSSLLSSVVALVMALPVVYTNVLEGIAQIDPRLTEMARLFGVPALARVRIVYVTQVLPYFRAAVTLALGLAWKAGIAAEVIGLPDLTVGEHLYDAKVYLDTPSLFAWTVAIVAVSAGLEALVRLALGRLEERREARP